MIEIVATVECVCDLIISVESVAVMVNGYVVGVTGNAEVYIVLALLIGFLTVVFGCWLSDNCWSPEPEELLAGG